MPTQAELAARGGPVAWRAQTGILEGICELCDRREGLRRCRPPEADVELLLCIDCSLAMPKGWTWFFWSNWHEYQKLTSKQLAECKVPQRPVPSAGKLVSG